MPDLLFVAVTALSFLTLAAFTFACDRLYREEGPHA